MDRLIDIARTGMRGAMARQTALANNLANANTTGFRQEIVNASARWTDGAALKSRASAVDQVIASDMGAGTVTATGNPLDVAIGGDGMLAVQANDGSEGYTRRGDLMLSDSGLLTTSDGHPVMGEGGPITLPPADKITIGSDGSITIIPQGGNPNQPQLIDRLKIVSPKGSAIAKGMDNLFREANGGTLPADPLAQATQGSLEGSNVNATTALIDMIDAGGTWQGHIKMIEAAKEVDQSGASLMRLDG